MLKRIILSVAMVSLLATGCAKTAEAATHQLSVGYLNNDVTDQDGVVLDAGLLLDNNVLLGLNTQFEDATIHSYGASVGTPILVKGTPFTLTPSVGIDHYREDSQRGFDSGTAGNVAIRAAYPIDTKTSVYTQAKYSKEFSNNDDLEGGSYAIGITRHF